MSLRPPLPVYANHTLSVAGTKGPEEIALLQRSQGDEVFIAWHGLTANNRLWFWDALWERGEVWLAGLPGHGAVRRYAPQHYWSWDAAHFISVGAALAQQFAGRKLTLIGHSTGGMIALGVATLLPELVERLVLISPVVWGELRGIIGLWARLARHPLLLHQAVRATLAGGRLSRRVFFLSLAGFAADWAGLFNNPHTALAVREGYHAYQHTPLLGISGTARVIAQADLRAQVQARPFNKPTLIIHGTRDPVVPFKQGRWLSETLPNAYLAAMPGVGHLPFGEREPLCMRWVTDWLALH